MKTHSEIFDELAAHVKQPLAVAAERAKETNCRQSITVLLLLCRRLDFIAQSILMLTDLEQIYSARILFRSLIEHYLKHHFIFMKSGITKTEECASVYTKFCTLNEELDLATAHRRLAKIMAISSDSSALDALRELHPELTETEEEIRKEASQYAYKRIIEFLTSHIYKSEHNSPDPFLTSIIPQYADLSSYVHGGPSADRSLRKLADPNERRKACKELADLTLSISAAVKMFTLVFLAHVDEYFVPVRSSFNSLMKSHKLPWSGAEPVAEADAFSGARN